MQCGVWCVAEPLPLCVPCCRFNPPGLSPPFCVEYYTGWLTHWGEPMANTSTALVRAWTGKGGREGLQNCVGAGCDLLWV